MKRVVYEFSPLPKALECIYNPENFKIYSGRKVFFGLPNAFEVHNTYAPGLIFVGFIASFFL